jgi:hypothetical protein
MIVQLLDNGSITTHNLEFKIFALLTKVSKTKDTEQLSIALARAYPNLALKIEKFKNLPAGREKQFALASLILENYCVSLKIFESITNGSSSCPFALAMSIACLSG